MISTGSKAHCYATPWPIGVTSCVLQLEHSKENFKKLISSALPPQANRVLRLSLRKKICGVRLCGLQTPLLVHHWHRDATDSLTFDLLGMSRSIVEGRQRKAKSPSWYTQFAEPNFQANFIEDKLTLNDQTKMPFVMQTFVARCGELAFPGFFNSHLTTFPLFWHLTGSEHE